VTIDRYHEGNSDIIDAVDVWEVKTRFIDFISNFPYLTDEKKINKKSIPYADVYEYYN
jgi:hypothetical protein